MGNSTPSMLKNSIDKIFGDKIGGATSGGQSSTSPGVSGTTGPTYGEMLNGGNASGGSSNVGAPTYGEMLNGSNPPYGASISEPLGSLASASASGLDTLEQFTQNAQLGHHDIYMSNVNFYDNQAKETINAINEQKTADNTYSQNVYDKEIESHTNIKNEGTTLAEGQRDLAFQYGESERDIRYTAAEEARAESDRIADIDRERSMVDAQSSYARNLATYGANAERLGRMGLTGSGYSDYLNAQAYATQRGEVQTAAARSEKAKREALYAEKQAKLDADSAFNQVKYNAESKYLDDMYDVNTTYEKNTTTSELDKLGRDHEADSTARKNTLAANQTAAAGIHESEVTYRENIIGTEKDLANHRVNEENRAEDKAAAKETERNSAYLEILSNPGVYSAEDIDALAKEYGFSEEQISSLKTAVENSKTETTQAIYEGLLKDVKNGVYTAEEVEMIAKNKGITDESLISSLTSAATKAVEDKAAADEEELKGVSVQNYQTVSTNIKTDPDFYSDAELDKMVADKLLTPDDAEAAKQFKKDIKAQYAREDINSIIASGDLGSLTTYLEEAYNGGSGVIDLNTYQDAYFRGALQNCASASGASEVLQVENDLKNLKEAGKITSADYDAAVKYLYASQGNSLEASAVKLSDDGYDADITIDGKTYNVELRKGEPFSGGLDENTIKTITMIAGGERPEKNALVMYGKKLYLFDGARWMKVLNNSSGGGPFYSKCKTLCEYQEKPAVPKHTLDKSSSSSQAGNTALRGRYFE